MNPPTERKDLEVIFRSTLAMTETAGFSSEEDDDDEEEEQEVLSAY